MRTRVLVLIVVGSIGASIALWAASSRQEERPTAAITAPAATAPLAGTSRAEKPSTRASPTKPAAAPRGMGPLPPVPATTTGDATLTMEERIERAEKLVETVSRAELDAIDTVAEDDDERELLLDNRERSRAGVESLTDDDEDEELRDVIGEELATRKQILGEERYIQYLKAFIAGLRTE